MSSTGRLFEVSLEPYEYFPVTVDFSNVLGTTETIASSSVSAVLRAGSTTSFVGTVSDSSVAVTAWVGGAANTVSGTTYYTSFRIVTSSTKRYEASGTFQAIGH